MGIALCALTCVADIEEQRNKKGREQVRWSLLGHSQLLLRLMLYPLHAYGLVLRAHKSEWVMATNIISTKHPVHDHTTLIHAFLHREKATTKRLIRLLLTICLFNSPGFAKFVRMMTGNPLSVHMHNMCFHPPFMFIRTSPS